MAFFSSPETPSNGGRPRQYQGVNLYVKNIDPAFDDRKLWEIFSKFGCILSCKVQCDENGISKGFGFVCYEHSNEAMLAIGELHGRVVGTKPLYVCIFESKEERAKNRLKKAVEYSQFTPGMPKPTSYEEFLQATLARGLGRSRGRGRGRSSGFPPSPDLQEVAGSRSPLTSLLGTPESASDYVNRGRGRGRSSGFPPSPDSQEVAGSRSPLTSPLGRPASASDFVASGLSLEMDSAVDPDYSPLCPAAAADDGSPQSNRYARVKYVPFGCPGGSPHRPMDIVAAAAARSQGNANRSSY